MSRPQHLLQWRGVRFPVYATLYAAHLCNVFTQRRVSTHRTSLVLVVAEDLGEDGFGRVWLATLEYLFYFPFLLRSYHTLLVPAYEPRLAGRSKL